MKKIILTRAVTVLSLSQQSFAGAEEIMGYVYDKEGISFQVSSNGCTKKKHFSAELSETFPSHLELVRDVKDTCKAIVHYGALITFKWSEIGLSSGGKFLVENEIMDISVQ